MVFKNVKYGYLGYEKALCDVLYSSAYIATVLLIFFHMLLISVALNLF